MLESLKTHTSMILKSINCNDLQFDIYEKGNRNIPDVLTKITFPKQFVVVLNLCESKHTNTISKQLSSLANINMQVVDNIGFWFEGDNLTLQPKKEQNHHKETKSLNTTIELPKWLDEFIYENLNASYNPDNAKFETNLELNQEENLVYLGTYFPRSFAEAYAIFSDFLGVEKIAQKYKKTSTLKILDVGCGTGGELTGLLVAINEKMPWIDTVIIKCYDGNEHALGIMWEIIKHYSQSTKFKIILSSSNAEIVDILNGNATFSGIERDEKFDLILSFKVVCELMKSGLKNAYHKYTKKLLPLLSQNGAFLLLDVTSKHNGEDYNPILLNTEVGKACKELKGYTTLVPIACRTQCDCQIRCFTQKTIHVSHSRHTMDISKIAYRMIVRDEFTEELPEINNNAKYIIAGNSSQGNIAFCTALPQNNQTDTVLDAYRLNTDETPNNTETPKVKVVGKIDLSVFETKKQKEVKSATKANIYVIDTNVFVNCPDIIGKIDPKYGVLLSAKVIDELDNLKIKLDTEGTKAVAQALKNINKHSEKPNIKLELADLGLLPVDFDKRSPDNLILSVALKYIKHNPILLTSDNGMQIKAKGLGLKTITLKEFLKK